MIDALVRHLADLLRFRGHFNIDDELQQKNIDNRRKALWNFFLDNPLFPGVVEDRFSPSSKQDLYLPDFADEQLHQRIAEQQRLIRAYESFWDERNRKFVYGKRGRKRQQAHRRLFKEQLAPRLKEQELSFSIKDELNICYMGGRGIVFPISFTEIMTSVDLLSARKGSLFYRGHELASYRLIPSVYRGKAASVEKELVYELISLIPEELGDAKSTFELLTKLQHFGTPTRLLDLTTNPLVALFFACKGGNGAGEVLCFDVDPENVKQFDSDTVSVIANLSKMPRDFEIASLPTTDRDKFNDHRAIKELVHKIRSEKSYFQNVVEPSDLGRSVFVVPKLDNPRIIRQSGAFIACGMSGYKTSPSPEIFDIERDVSVRIVIPKGLKKSVLQTLDAFNISSGSLFPDLSEISGYMHQKYGL